MTALTKGINIQSFGRSNFMLTVVVCLVVIALFFIPEIIGFQRSFHKTSSSHLDSISARAAKREQPVVAGELSQPEVSPLDEVSKLINFRSALPQAPQSVIAPAQPQLKEGGSNVDPNLLAKCVATLSEPVEKKAERNLSQSPLTWEKIRAPESQDILRRAQAEALAISRSIGPKKTESRYALITFSNAINAVLTGSDQFSSPEEAIGYVETVDQAVTKAIFREGVDRADYMRWQQVSLGPELKTSRVARTKAQYSMPFNPRITMEYVGVRQLDPNPNESASVDFRGYMYGKDIKKVEVLWKGDTNEISLSDPDPKTGRRYFSNMLVDARGVYTLIVTDFEGNKYEKSYEFFPRVVGYQKNSNGFYVIPYNSKEMGEGDPRLDRMFRTAGRRGVEGASNTSFSTF
ncbi:MAG: hypothetical protein J0M12_17095 [Deltaproteobacteria bacterium]|nr:hypothetical protein [Deltaproteobacteria bacterium]